MRLPEAMRLLVSSFALSHRQAYRYLQQASRQDRAVKIPEVTVPITLKLPLHTVELLRKHARSKGLTMGSIVTEALQTSLRTRKRHG